jgi:peptidyl-prolyl cis-trans isomerase D
MTSRKVAVPAPAHRKHLARAEREARLRVVIMIAAGLTALLIIGILGYGYYDIKVLQPRQPIITVDGQPISTHDFEVTAKLMMQDLQSKANSYAQLQQIFGSDPQISSQIQTQLNQIQLQLTNPTIMAQQVQEKMIQDILIRREAEKRGITVTDQEVTDTIQGSFGFYPNGTPTPTPTSVIAATATLNPTEQASITPSPTPTVGPSPTTPPTSTPGPTATPFTQESYDKTYQSFLDDMKTAGISEADYREYVRASLYGKKVVDAFHADVPRDQEMVHARHILVADEATAQEVLKQFKAGTPWEELAKTYSTDTSNKDNGGDLGWFAKGQMVAEFETAAFNTPVGQVSDPVQTSYGWHLIQVLGKEVRQLDDSTYEQVVQADFNKWLADQRSASDVKVIGDPTQLIPVLPTG